MQVRGVSLPPPSAAPPPAAAKPAPTVMPVKGVTMPPAAPAGPRPEEPPRPPLAPTAVQVQGVQLPARTPPPAKPPPLAPTAVQMQGVRLPAQTAPPVAAPEPAPTAVGVRGIQLGVTPGGPAVAPAPPPGRPAGPIADPPPGARGAGWQAWEHAGPMPRRLRVGGQVWNQVDRIDARDPASEEAHGFELQETMRLLREQGSWRYPSGGAVDGRGYRHTEGYAVFTVRGLTPYAPLAIVRQVLAVGEELLEVRVAGRKVGDSESRDYDERAPWRNRAFVVPSNRITTPEVRVEISDEGSPDGVTWFSVWCYQPEGE